MGSWDRTELRTDESYVFSDRTDRTETAKCGARR